MKQNKLWFRAKNYGWGWYPITWQGWLVVLIYVLGIVSHAFRAVNIAKANGNSEKEFLWSYLSGIFILTIIMIWICYKKGEKPEWRWKGKRIFK